MVKGVIIKKLWEKVRKKVKYWRNLSIKTIKDKDEKNSLVNKKDFGIKANYYNVKKIQNNGI